jgi:hypothetical protein
VAQNLEKRKNTYIVAEEEGEKKRMVGENGKSVEYEEKDECLSFHLGQSNFNLLCLETRKRRTPPTMNLFT